MNQSNINLELELEKICKLIKIKKEEEPKKNCKISNILSVKLSIAAKVTFKFQV
jgi:hypothetical protein